MSQGPVLPHLSVAVCLPFDDLDGRQRGSTLIAGVQIDMVRPTHRLTPCRIWVLGDRSWRGGNGKRRRLLQLWWNAHSQ